MQRPRRATKVPVHLRILTVLHFLDLGGYQVGTGHGYLIAQSQPAVSRCIAEVTNLMTAHLLNVWIKFPNSDEERQRIKRGFQELAPTFANVVGVVDCTHIRIVAPPAEHPIYPGHAYYCRKGFFSINAQIICDSNRIIRNINARFPGSVHDSAIWMTSGAKRALQQHYVQTGSINYLIGDSGYPLEPWLMVPFVNPPDNTPQSRFNTALSNLRIIIEHTNGLLKGRFRSLHGHRALHYNPLRVAKLIYSGAILHNMCRTYNVPLPNDEDVLPRPPRPINQPVAENNADWFNQGSRLRNHIVESHFAEQ
jgi:hypothetical protein